MDAQSLLIYFTNALITLLYYFQSYFWYIVMFILFVITGVLEYKEKQVLFVDDERKVV